MRLEHHHAGEAAHPVNVGEPVFYGNGLRISHATGWPTPNFKSSSYLPPPLKFLQARAGSGKIDRHAGVRKIQLAAWSPLCVCAVGGGRRRGDA